jgi:hypothetical protein
MTSTTSTFDEETVVRDNYHLFAPDESLDCLCPVLEVIVDGRPKRFYVKSYPYFTVVLVFEREILFRLKLLYCDAKGIGLHQTFAYFRKDPRNRFPQFLDEIAKFYQHPEEWPGTHCDCGECGSRPEEFIEYPERPSKSVCEQMVRLALLFFKPSEEYPKVKEVLQRCPPTIPNGECPKTWFSLEYV